MDGMYKSLSQFDGPEVLKSAHEDKNQTIRVTNGVTSVPPWYSRTDVIYNPEGSITHIEFFGGTQAEVREVVCVADSFGSLNNTYFTLYSEYDKSKYYIWYNVDNTGVDPAPSGFTGIEIPIQTNENAEIVAYATELLLKNFEEFKVTRNKDLLRITNIKKGIATNSIDVGTGFIITIINSGAETLIKAIDIPFDGEVKYLFNEQERKFEVVPLSTGTISVDITADNGNSVFVYGSETGDESGTKHVIRVDSDGSQFTKTLNNLIHKEYDTVQVTTKTINGPTTVVYRNGGLAGSIVAVAALTYDIDGDFESIEVTQ